MARTDASQRRRGWSMSDDLLPCAPRAAPTRASFFPSPQSGTSMSRPAVNVAVRAARAAGQIILRHMNRLESLAVVEKQQLDFVSEVDRMAEAEIIRELKRAYPDARDARRGIRRDRQGQNTWVIDPLDGTHNYLRGFPHFCVSIALLEHGDPIVGVVFDPLRNELFTASKGDGAFLNDRRMRVGKREGPRRRAARDRFSVPPARAPRCADRHDARVARAKPKTSAAPARPRSTSPMSPPDASMASRDRPQAVGHGRGLPADARSRRPPRRFRRARRHAGERQFCRRQHQGGEAMVKAIAPQATPALLKA